MSKYSKLRDYLRDSTEQRTTLSFAEIERIVGAPLPESARVHREWWANGGHSHAVAWLEAGFRVDGVEFGGSLVSFARSGPAPAERPARAVSLAGATQRRRSRWPRAYHLGQLRSRFDQALSIFDQRRIFSGPSEHFYLKTVAAVRQASSLRALIANDAFAECVYATLTSWGMHRMGENVATKLAEFSNFRDTLDSLLREADPLRSISLLTLNERDGHDVAKRLGPLLERRGLGTSASTLVLNAKSLHFLLPDLVPPIDRRYTLKFFFGTGAPHGGPAETFADIYPEMVAVSQEHGPLIRNLCEQSAYLCAGHAKVIDNAIVGYLLGITIAQD
jgi:hypothetical protein